MWFLEKLHHVLVERTLDLPKLSQREPTVRFTEGRRYFISEATVYRILKEHNLVTFPS